MFLEQHSVRLHVYIILVTLTAIAFLVVLAIDFYKRHKRLKGVRLFKMTPNEEHVRRWEMYLFNEGRPPRLQAGWIATKPSIPLDEPDGLSISYLQSKMVRFSEGDKSILSNNGGISPQLETNLTIIKNQHHVSMEKGRRISVQSRKVRTRSNIMRIFSNKYGRRRNTIYNAEAL